MSYALYAVGLIIVIAALAYAAVVLGVPTLWVGIAVAIVAGLAVMAAAARAMSTREVHTHTTAPPVTGGGTTHVHTH